MLYVLTSSEKPVGEMTPADVGFRKVNNERAAFFVASSAEKARKLAIHVFGDRGVSIPTRPMTKEELQVLQMQCSSGTVKFVFEVLEDAAGKTSYHTSIHTVDERA